MKTHERRMERSERDSDGGHGNTNYGCYSAHQAHTWRRGLQEVLGAV